MEGNKARLSLTEHDICSGPEMVSPEEVEGQVEGERLCQRTGACTTQALISVGIRPVVDELI